MTNEEAREHMDMLIAHKDKAIETHPYLRCDGCIHYEEQDGSNCYECIKGMVDNFEAQPKTGYISIDVKKLAKEVAEKALDEITYEGKTIREWAEILVNQQPSEDCISREEALRHSHIEYDDDGEGRKVIYTEDIEELPPVTPQASEEDIYREREQAYMLGYEDASKKFRTEPSEDCVRREQVEEITFQEPSYTDPYNILTEVREKVRALPSVTPRMNLAETSQDCISRQKALDCFEQTNTRQGAKYAIETLPSVYPERPKGKWIYQLNRINLPICSECDNPNEFGKEYKFCPNCGAYMSGGEEDEGDS